MCDDCTWHHKTFLVQLYWHFAIKLYCIVAELHCFKTSLARCTVLLLSLWLSVSVVLCAVQVHCHVSGRALQAGASFCEETQGQAALLCLQGVQTSHHFTAFTSVVWSRQESEFWLDYGLERVLLFTQILFQKCLGHHLLPAPRTWRTSQSGKKVHVVC